MGLLFMIGSAGSSASRRPFEYGEREMIKITSVLRSLLVKRFGMPAEADDQAVRTLISAKITTGELDPKEIVDAHKAAQQAKDAAMTLTPAQMFASHAAVAAPVTTITVRDASWSYPTTKNLGMHVKTGMPVQDERGRQVLLPSACEKAKAGAWLKFLASRERNSGVNLNDEDRGLLDEIYTKDHFVGEMQGQWSDHIPGLKVKAILNDTLSGGAEVVPEWFDTMLITYPLLHSELYPFVTLRDVPRSNHVQAAAINNVDAFWGTSEGAEIPLFDTDAMIQAIDTSIHAVTIAVELGRDFLADSAASVGSTVEELMGERMTAELDRIIAVGNGASEPLGIFNASGITTITSTNGNAGPPTVDDYETLMKTVGKQYRNQANRCAYLMNDTTYFRARGIAVGASDQRRVFGMDEQSYQLFSWPCRIQNDIANTKAIFGALARYRMYRRAGFAMEMTTEGKELRRKNLMLITARGRFGGQVVDPNAFAIIEDAKS